MCKPAHLPVVVQVTELVREPLHVVRLQSAGVVDDVVVSGWNASWSDRLAHDVEVVPGGEKGTASFIFPLQHQHIPRRTVEAYHSGRVTSVSMTVPGGGLVNLSPIMVKNLLLMRFLTTTTLNLGLQWGDEAHYKHKKTQARF